MAEPEGMQALVNPAVIQVVKAVMMVLRDADVGPQPATTASPRRPQRQRYGGSALKKVSFTWNAQDRHIELIIFETGVMNIFETKAYELTKEKVPVIKNW